MMLATRGEDFQALFLRAPLQNVDVNLTNTPVFHLEPAGFVKIDGVGADQGSAVIIDDIFFIRIGDSESGSERKTRPIGRGAHDVGARKAAIERVAAAASLAMRIG